ncbi:MAG TPA: Na+/H+ antiporter NhaC family protein [Cyclobacteriaceae bacterium]|nr:Na+/H+ antiporter NhaC family protein [Cyclobacteriaceae bacterium]
MSEKGKLSALFPLLFFVVVYMASSIYLNDFYSVPVLVAFLLSLLVAFVQYPTIKFKNKLAAFTAGAGNDNILIMILIFLLAGAFGQISRDMGAISSIVNFSLQYVSPQIIIAALFLISAFISISLGTSVGTIAALSPIAVGLSEQVPDSLAIALASIIGGAMFGDNLSFISDTTIAASRTQGIGMKEKFKANIKIVILPMLITFTIYLFFNQELSRSPIEVVGEYDLVKIVPYLMVFALAITGVNVIATLTIGIFLSLIIGGYFQEFSWIEAVQSVNQGLAGMYELSLICLIIGGIVGIIRMNGGIDYLLYQVLKRVDSAKKAELGIAFLTGMVNLSIANNTITIIIVGPIAKEIALTHQVKLTRSASIMDTMSCFVQGIIPYGAQMLAAMAVASFAVSPLEILQYLYYPLLTGLFTLAFIFFGKRKGVEAQGAEMV